MLLVRMHRPPRFYGGAWWPEFCEPPQWGRQVVLDCVVGVLRLCRMGAVPRRWWDWWQGLVVLVGVFVVHVMVWCGQP